MIFLKRITWILFFLALAYGGYTLYVHWWDKGTSFSRTKEYVQNVFGKKREEVQREVQDKAYEIVSSTKKTALNYIEEKTSEAFDSIKQGIVNKTSEFLGTTPKTGVFKGGVISSPSGSGFQAPPPPATITANIGFPLVFSINRNASYTVDWGDGNNESGVSAPNQVTLLKHEWKSQGDYMVNIRMNGSGSSTEYVFPVRIYK